MSNKHKAIARQNSAVKQLERAKRQVILMRILEVAQGKGDNPTFIELAEKMREDPWVAARWPSYSPDTAHRDFTELMSISRDDIKALAGPYFVKHVTTMDEVTEVLADFVRDKTLPHKVRIDSANAIRGYLDQSARVFGNYAPKELHIQQQKITGTLDDYIRLKEQAKKELESDIIDGEIEND